jgi:hypothetical protein
MLCGQSASELGEASGFKAARRACTPLVPGYVNTTWKLANLSQSYGAMHEQNAEQMLI